MVFANSCYGDEGRERRMVGSTGSHRLSVRHRFLLLIDELTPHLHIGTDKPEGIKSHMSKTAMLALAVTIHNLPEGMAVGVVFAGAETVLRISR